MIYNIIDQREISVKWKRVNAVVESTCGDNNVEGADFIELTDDLIFGELNEVSVREAIAWANSFKEPVTLYIYDAG